MPCWPVRTQLRREQPHIVQRHVHRTSGIVLCGGHVVSDDVGGVSTRHLQHGRHTDSVCIMYKRHLQLCHGPSVCIAQYFRLVAVTVTSRVCFGHVVRLLAGPSGLFGATSGLSSASCSGPCPRGTYSLGGAVTCTACPASTYGDSVALSSPACSGSCFAPSGKYRFACPQLCRTWSKL